METITVKELREQIAEGGAISASQIIDVRTPSEHRSISIEGAQLIPLDEFTEEKAREIVPEKAIYLLCKSGARSAIAQAKLSANSILIEGGIDAWANEKFPVNLGKASISLERQVRITAGSLVFLGALLSLFVTQYFLIVPAFIGAGLAFAGITNTCGMGTMLAKMPWNKI